MFPRLRTRWGFKRTAVLGAFLSAQNICAFADPIERLEAVVRDQPRGQAGIPWQWLEMRSLIGWEKMMLVFGYADNRSACEALARIAKDDSPGRDFRCESAN
jgi:hypothetical protein